MDIDLYSHNISYISESVGIDVPTIQLRLIGINLASGDFKKEIQCNFETPRNLGRSTTQNDSIINKLGMVDGLNAFDKTNSWVISFNLQPIESFAE